MNPRQIGELLTEIKVEQGVTNAKLDSLTTLVEKHALSDEKTFADHEKRIRSNERARWYAGGVAGVVASVLTVGATYFKIGGN